MPFRVANESPFGAMPQIWAYPELQHDRQEGRRPSAHRAAKPCACLGSYCPSYRASRSANLPYFRYTDLGYAVMPRSARLNISGKSFAALARKNFTPLITRSWQASVETCVFMKLRTSP
jgi:hypothetical protein